MASNASVDTLLDELSARIARSEGLAAKRIGMREVDKWLKRLSVAARGAKADSGRVAEAIVKLLEAHVAEKMHDEAVHQRLNGTLVVDPNKMYVSREQGKRALTWLEGLSRKAGRRPGAGRSVAAGPRKPKVHP